MANPAGTLNQNPGVGTPSMAALETHGWRNFFSGRGEVAVLDKYGTLVARILISIIFLASGIMKIVDWSGTEAHMASRGMFWIPFFHVLALMTEIGAGTCLLLGNKIRLSSAVLILFLIPVTLTFHNFWTYADPKEQQLNMIMFLHNLALMGGLMYVLVHGAGPVSVDANRKV